MMKISHFLSVTALTLFSAAANAATVWAPTNVDTDFIQVPGYSTNGGVLALFDEADFGGTKLEIGSNGGEVRFAMSGSDWSATFFDKFGTQGGTITLTGDSNFTLGMTWDRGTTWFADSFYEIASAPDAYRIDFAGGNDFGPLTGSTLAVDLQPAVPQVPVPAAAWLFGTGLIGLVGVARRRV